MKQEHSLRLGLPNYDGCYLLEARSKKQTYKNVTKPLYLSKMNSLKIHIWSCTYKGKARPMKADPTKISTTIQQLKGNIPQTTIKILVE